MRSQTTLGCAALLVFFAALTRAGIVATDFGGFAHDGFGLFMVPLALFVRVGLTVDEIPTSFVAFAKMGDLVVLESLTFVHVMGRKLNDPLAIGGFALARRKDFKPLPLGPLGPFFRTFRVEIAPGFGGEGRSKVVDAGRDIGGIARAHQLLGGLCEDVPPKQRLTARFELTLGPAGTCHARVIADFGADRKKC